LTAAEAVGRARNGRARGRRRPGGPGRARSRRRLGRRMRARV